MPWRLPLAILLPAALLAAPVLRVDRTRHAFGDIPPSAPVRAAFQVTNAGDGVLRLLRALPSCDCTTAALDREALGPGESATLTMVFDPTRDRGHVERSILLVTDAPAAPRVELVYEAEVVLPVMASEEAVFFPATLPHDHLVREVAVRSTVDADLSLALLSPAPPFLRVTVAGAGRRARVTVAMDGSLLPREGAANGVLTFSTGVREVPRLLLEYYAYPGRAVEAQPEGLAFDPALTGRAQAFTVRLVEARERPFRVLSLAPPPAPFHAELLTSGSAAVHEVKVSLGAEVVAGAYRGTLVLKVEDPDQDTVSIPLTALLQ